MTRSPFKISDSLWLLFLITLTITFTCIYIDSERTFYWWDFVIYQYRTLDIWNAWQESPTIAFDRVFDSLGNDYNKLYTLPLLPFLLILEPSRLAFVLGIVVAYQLPFSLALGAIATKLIPVNPRLVFGSTVALALLTPATWVPSLRGFPDIGGAFLLLLVIWIYLHDTRLKRWWQIPLIGLTIGAAILFRRHFAYGGVAFFASAIAQNFVCFLRNFKQFKFTAWQDFINTGLKLFIVALISFSTLAIFAWNFTHRALTVNYRSIYESWSLPVDRVFEFYAFHYGWIAWGLAIVGFAIGLATRKLARSRIGFIALFGIFSAIEWLFLLRYDSIHYTLHLAPIVILGIAVGLWSILLLLDGRVQTISLSLVCLYWFANSAIALTPIATFYTPFRPLFAASYPPLVRQDYHTLVELLSQLYQLAPNGEPIYLASHSGVLNRSLARNADWQLHQNGQIPPSCSPPCGSMNFLGIQQLDSVGTYPIQTLLNAQYVAVAKPFQYRVNPDEQDVTKVTVDAFVENWKIARDFDKLPVKFTLQDKILGGVHGNLPADYQPDNPVEVEIYQRRRPTPLDTTLQTLARMRRQIGSLANPYADWIVLNSPSPSWVEPRPPGNYRLQLHAGDRDLTSDDATILFYLGKLQERSRLRGTVTFQNPDCTGVSLMISAIGDRGQILSQTSDRILANSTHPQLDLAIDARNATYLMLQVTPDSPDIPLDYCSFSVDRLAFSETDAAQ
jgi:hypothetical protein